MDREQAKLLLPIIKAFSEGGTIQGKAHRNGSWNIDYGDDLPFEDLWDTSMFRIKPEPKYRPFKDMKECWKEMLKHYPFGWVTPKGYKNIHYNILKVSSGLGFDDSTTISVSYLDAFNDYTFIDDEPFGIKED